MPQFVLQRGVRFAIVRGWAALATAILTAVGSDITTEFAENGGWLGGALRDNQHEAVLPALLFGSVVALSLTLFVLLARIRPGDPLLSGINHFRTRCVDIAGTLVGSIFCVVAMEGYETRFGGVSPFDPRSVILSHALPLVVTFVVTGAIVHYALRAAIAAASRASGFISEVLGEFLRKLFDNRRSSEIARVSAFALNVVHVRFAFALGSRGLRAPPHAVVARYLIA
jgi:hypothetical protein